MSAAVSEYRPWLSPLSPPAPRASTSVTASDALYGGVLSSKLLLRMEHVSCRRPKLPSDELPLQPSAT